MQGVEGSQLEALSCIRTNGPSSISEIVSSVFFSKLFSRCTSRLRQRGKTGGPRTTANPRPIVTKPLKLLITNLLLVTISSFVYFLRRIWKKKSRSLYCLLFYVHVRVRRTFLCPIISELVNTERKSNLWYWDFKFSRRWIWRCFKGDYCFHH